MKDFAITSQHDFDRATQRLSDLERFADRRDQVLDTLDLRGLGPDQRDQIDNDDERINEDLAWGHLYLAHLAEMERLGCSISGCDRMAA